jgi:hypothetical protein
MKRITFDLDGVEYKLPQQLTIENYVKIYKVKDLFDEEYFLPRLINILTDAPMDLLLKAERGKVQMLNQPLMDILPSGNPPFLDRFELDGVQYGFIPSWKKMSFGEFADLDTLMTKKPEDMLDYIHIITAIMYRPIISEKTKHKFEIEEYNQVTLEERAELFKKKLDVEVALGGQFFFTQFAKNYLNPTRISLKSWMKISWVQIKMAWRMRKWIWKLIFRKRLDGTSFLIDFQTMMLQDTNKLLKKQSQKP